MELVDYLGKKVPREHFRVFIYNAKNEKKLINSWDEFQEHMSSGIWFSALYEQPEEELTSEITKIPKNSGQNKHKRR